MCFDVLVFDTLDGLNQSFVCATYLPNIWEKNSKFNQLQMARYSGFFSVKIFDQWIQVWYSIKVTKNLGIEKKIAWRHFWTVLFVLTTQFDWNIPICLYSGIQRIGRGNVKGEGEKEEEKSNINLSWSVDFRQIRRTFLF